MDFIKKKPLMTLSLAIAIVVAAFLAVKIKHASESASLAGEKIESLKAFGIKVAKASYSASQGNVTISGENVKQTQEKLLQLREALYEASHVTSTRKVTNTQCKNHLFEGTGKLVEELERKGVFVSQSAKYLSFNTVINAQNLPNEITEVPVLMKQFKIIREVVEVIKTAEIARLLSLGRPEGVGVANKDQFQVMPLTMKVEGSSSAVKTLISDLQKDKNYYFVIRTISFTALEPKIGGGENSSPVAASTGHMIPFSVANDGAGDRAGNEPVAPVAYAEQFKVRFPDRITADIRFDFIEFKKPVEEK